MHFCIDHQNKRYCRKLDEPSGNQCREKFSDVLTSETAKIAKKTQNCRTDSALYLTGTAN